MTSYPAKGVPWPSLPIDTAFLRSYVYTCEPKDQFNRYVFPNGRCRTVFLHDVCFITGVPVHHVYRLAGEAVVLTEIDLTDLLIRTASCSNIQIDD